MRCRPCCPRERMLCMSSRAQHIQTSSAKGGSYRRQLVARAAAVDLPSVLGVAEYRNALMSRPPAQGALGASSRSSGGPREENLNPCAGSYRGMHRDRSTGVLAQRLNDECAQL